MEALSIYSLFSHNKKRTEPTLAPMRFVSFHIILNVLA